MTDELEARVLDTTDAQVWAQEFMKLFDERRDEIDEGLMIGWFANAIETGRTAGVSSVTCPCGHPNDHAGWCPRRPGR